MNRDTLSDTAARARAWHHARHAVCDVIEPWAHGTVVRATQYPDIYDLNVVRVEEDAAMSMEELVAFADEALSELAHRRVDFDLVEAAERLRGGLEANGWEATRLLWMRHEAPLPPGPDIAVEAVSYDAVQDLRLAWFREDFPDLDPGAFLAQAREVDLSQGVQVLAVLRGERAGGVRPASPARSGGRDHPRLRPFRAARQPARHGSDARGDRRGRGRQGSLDRRRRRGPAEGAVHTTRFSPRMGFDGIRATSVVALSMQSGSSA